MSDEEHADSDEWRDINAMIAEARETFLNMVAEDSLFDDAFNNATREVFAELQFVRELADKRSDVLRLERERAKGVQSFAAQMIAKTILELCEFEDRAQQARADLSRCSRRLALMLAPMFPGDGILASLTVSHDSAVARINHLVRCEAALRDVIRSMEACAFCAFDFYAGDPSDLRTAHEALDNARSLIHYSDSAPEERNR